MNRLALAFVYIVWFSLIMACQQMDQRGSEADHEPITDPISFSESGDHNTSIAHHLADIAQKVPNVEEATAIIAGPFAVVGIDIDKDLDRQSVGVVKYTVTEALHEDPYGKTSIVIADGDILQRLENMREEISDGRPVQGVIDELASIVARYMPTMPVPENQPIEKDENNNIISEDKDEEIKDIQKEQSKE